MYNVVLFSFCIVFALNCLPVYVQVHLLQVTVTKLNMNGKNKSQNGNAHSDIKNATFFLLLNFR